MITTVVNLRHEKCDVKICRKPDNSIPNPPETGCFGNPFFLKNVNDDKERDEVIEKYEIYFRKRIDEDFEFRKAVLSLRGKRLGCFCFPRRCHGHIIVKWLEENNE